MKQRKGYKHPKLNKKRNNNLIKEIQKFVWFHCLSLLNDILEANDSSSSTISPSNSKLYWAQIPNFLIK